MTIVLLILKYIGIALLVILALLILLVLAVLFVPVRYRICGSYHNKELNLKVRAGWLLRIVLFGLDITQEQRDIYLRILGIKKNLAKSDNPQDFEDTMTENAVLAAQSLPEDETRESVAEQDDPDGADQTAAETNTDEAVEDVEKSGGWFARIYQKFLDLIQKVRDLYTGIRMTVTNIRATLKKITRLVRDEKNQQAIKYIGGQLFELLKKITPKKLTLDLVYSTGSPDTTGELLGVLALFPIAYQNRWNITPDFTADQFYAEAEFDVKGRIFVYQVVGIVLRVIRDQNCRRLYHRFQKQ